MLAVLIKSGRLEVLADCEPAVKFWLQQRDQNNRHPQAPLPGVGARVRGPREGTAADAAGAAVGGAAATTGPASDDTGGAVGGGRPRRTSLVGTPYAAELAAARKEGQQRARLDRQVRALSLSLSPLRSNSH